MPVILDHDGHRADVIGSLLGVKHTVVSTADQLTRWLGRRPEEYAVVLGPQVDLVEAMRIADGLRLTRPSTSIICLRDEVDAESLSQALRAGIRDVVRLGDTEGLTAAVSRAREMFEAINGPTIDSPGRVITVYSPKGGVGKTTLAVNLAHALTDEDNQRVCLVDLDLAFGDVAITMQLIPQHTIAEAAEVSDLDLSLLENLLTQVTPNLSVLAAPTHPDAKTAVNAGVVRRVLTALRGRFDVIVIDTAPGFEEEVLQAFDDTDECIVIGTLDVPTIKNVKMALETMDILELVIGHRHVVLNRVGEDVGLTSANVESILGTALAMQIPHDDEIPRSTNYGVPIVVAQPDHVVSRAVRELAALVGRADDLASGPSPKTSGHRRRGLFRRAS
ncbi:hypothetical protein GCM10027425_11420 [Alteromonas gracilis]